MSDVNIKTSWDSIPANDSEFNTVLGVAGYDPDNNRLFLSAQQTPNPARNVTTEYARGFSLNSGYDGITRHDAITETAKDLKTVKFTMSMAGTAYDLTDARCYIQFKNHYSVDIASWSLQAQAADDTLTTITSGGAIAAGALVQIDFKNDYDAARFIMTITYSGDKQLNQYWYKAPVTYSAPWQYIGTTITSSPTAPNVDMWMFSMSNRVYYTFNNVQGAVFAGWNPNTGEYSGRQNVNSTYRGLTYGYSPVGNVTPVPQAPYNSINAMLDNFIDAPAGGVNTSDFNAYTGPVWQCRMLANIAAISPGPMATESEGGAEGDFDVTSDALAIPALPDEGQGVAPKAGDLYLLSSTQLANVQQALFGSTIANALRDIFGNAIDGIISLQTYPLPVTAYTVRFTSNVFSGGQDLGSSTNTDVVNRYIEYDCGTVDLHLFWDSALDLNPYTKLMVYMPGIGERVIDADVCMGHTIGLKYHIDLLTGVCIAFITVDGDVYQQHAGTLGQHMAFSGTRNGQIMAGILSGLAGNASALTSGGGEAVQGALSASATFINASKSARRTVGNFSGSTSQIALLQPYIDILRPIQQLPRNYTHFNAYPCYMTAQLINLSGWTEIQDIYIDDIDCTEPERADLLALLQSGIIL